MLDRAVRTVDHIAEAAEITDISQRIPVVCRTPVKNINDGVPWSPLRLPLYM